MGFFISICYSHIIHSIIPIAAHHQTRVPNCSISIVELPIPEFVIHRTTERIIQFVTRQYIKSISKDIPSNFMNYMYHVMKLKFDEKPDYDFLINILLEKIELH